jgi:hypothetical protein
MKNQFLAANYAVTEPTSIVVGDRVAFKRSDIHAAYPNTDYTLKYAARKEGDGLSEIEITAVASGVDYLIEIASAVTSTWTTGTYQWQSYIIRNSDSQRVTLGTGLFKVFADKDSSTDSADPISHLRKRLSNLETAIETLSSKTSSSYSIAGRSMSFGDLTELEQMRDKTVAEISVRERGRFGVRG